MKQIDGMEGKVCHIDKQPCIGEKCGQYRFIEGTDFQTGEKIQRWDCAMANQQLMQGEQSAYARETRDELHALKRFVRISCEVLLQVAGRKDLLDVVDARMNHTAALTRTEELRDRNKTPVKADA